LATGEHILIHVSLEPRRPAPFSPDIAANLKMISEAQAGLDAPEGVGRYVGQPR
jgi:carnitine 3-dehydrogenase